MGYAGAVGCTGGVSLDVDGCASPTD